MIISPIYPVIANSHKAKKPPQLRRFSHEQGKGQANLLFRPVGQIALAQALGILVFKNQIPIDTLFEKLYQFDEAGGFSQIEKPSSLWYGILYDPLKKRIQVAGRKLAAKLIVYLLGGMDEKEQHQLDQEFVQARTIEKQAINFNGENVAPEAIKLPTVL